MSTVTGGPQIIKDNLVVHLDVANKNSYPGNGTTWYDLTTQFNNATIIGSPNPTYSTTYAGGLDFSGSATQPRFTIPNPQLTTEPFAVDLWFTQRIVPDPVNDYIRGILSIGDLWGTATDGSYPGWAIGYYPSTPTIVAGMYAYSGSTSQYNTRLRYNGPTVVAGGVYNVFIHRNTNDQKFYYYVNNTQYGNSTMGNQYSIAGSTSTINEVVWNAGPFSAPLAIYHSIKVYHNKNFTEAERLQNYNALKSRFGL